MPKRREELPPPSPSSSPMSGTFTRSRYEMFLHRTRSGRARPDPIRHCPAVAVKDLRSKRVFSDLNPKISVLDDQVDDGERKRSRSGNLDFDEGVGVRVSAKSTMSRLIGNPSSIGYKRLLPYLKELTKEEKPHILCMGDSHILNCGENRISVENRGVEDPKVSSHEDIVNRSTKVESPNTCDGCIGDVVPRTPPGGELASQFEVPEVGSGKKILEPRQNHTSAIQSGLSACSRSKLIENPSSMSYKRLLPHLQDLAKDGSNGIEILHSKNCLPKVEKIIKESHHTMLLGDSLTENCGENHDFKENIVLGNSPISSHEDSVHKPLKVESPNLCCKTNLQVQKDTSKVNINDQQMDEPNAHEQKGENEEGNESDVMLHTSDCCPEDIGQSTPPDAEVANKLEETEGRSEKGILEPRACNSLGNGSRHAPRLRSKLYQNPNSFSYRRLLPFLMDLAKNDTSDMEVLHSQKCPTQFEDNIGASPVILNTTFLSSQQNHTSPLVDSLTVHSREKQDSGEGCVFENPILESPRILQNPGTPELPNSCTEDKLQVNGTISEAPLERSNFEVYMTCNSSYHTPNRENLSVQELAGNMLMLSYSPLKNDRKLIQQTSHLETAGHRAIQALAPRKGILKRQSRGCKGICMCLDCASFRLHAKRTYEFSRKQMIEADGVVEGLMKELLCLRNLVERSLVPLLDGAGNYTVLRVDQDQVKGVCQRAFRVEKLAKNRMREMFSDLNTHCRNPGPRVTFSEYVDQRNIP